MTVRVVTVINHWAVQELGGQLATWEGTQRVDPKSLSTKKAEQLGTLNSKGPSTVSVAVEEKLSGPSGTYSSISVRVEVSARCDQDDKEIDRAHGLLFTEGLRALEHYMSPAMAMLMDHTSRQG